VSAAETCDLLEEQGRELPVEGSQVRLSLAPFETATVKANCRRIASGGVCLGTRAEPRQPVYVRYWRYNKHAAPLGFLPCAVRLDPPGASAGQPPKVTPPEPLPPVQLQPGEAVRLRAVVANNRVEPIAGTLSVSAPEGWGVSVSAFHFEMEAGGHKAFDFVVDCPGDALRGAYCVRAEVDIGDGQRYCDYCEIGVSQAPEAALDASWEATPVKVTRGGQGALVLRLHNRAPQTVEGEAQLCAPFEAWEFLGPYTQTFSVPAGGRAQVSYDFRPPEWLEPGRYWAMVKVMYRGRLYYTEALDLEVL